MKRWVLYVDGEEPLYFDGDDVAKWRSAGGDHLAGIKEMEALEVGWSCFVADGKVQRLEDERMAVCDVVGCYETFATHKGETLCPHHRVNNGIRRDPNGSLFIAERHTVMTEGGPIEVRRKR